MYKSPLLYGTALALALFGTGCETGGVSSRIQEKATVFGTLTSDQQQTIKAGGVERGYSPDMVYMAVGKPSKMETLDTPQGKVEKWTYNKYFGPRPSNTGGIVNGPGLRPQGTIYGLNSPTVLTDSKSNPSSTSTKGGVQTSLNVPDIEATVLMIYFLEGAVYDMKIKDPGQ